MESLRQRTEQGAYRRNYPANARAEALDGRYFGRRDEGLSAREAQDALSLRARGFDFDFDLDLLGDHQTARFENGVPVQTEVFAIDGAVRRDADHGLAVRALPRAAVLDIERD